MFGIGTHRGFRLSDGNRIFERGGISRLLRRYGHRARAIREEGEPLYRITERYLGHTVWTAFWVDRSGPKAIVMDVFILFPPAG